MRLLLVVPLLLASCSDASDGSPAEAPLDRSGFETVGCALSTFDTITPATAVDAMELRAAGNLLARRGELCSGATDRAACQQKVAAASVQGWPHRPDGGTPSPLAYIVATRGDVVEAIGVAELVTFLGPINLADAAFLAEVATRGRVDCARPAARVAADGFEVITTTMQTCGGEVSEQRVFVTTSGTATVRETRVIHRGEQTVCA